MQPPEGRAVSRRYRNRRIGEFLKELDLTEGRSTGISKIIKAMAANGSPPPEFESDEDRTHFLIRLPVHDKVAEIDAEAEKTAQETGTGSEKKRGEKVGEKVGESWKRFGENYPRNYPRKNHSDSSLSARNDKERFGKGVGPESRWSEIPLG